MSGCEACSFLAGSVARDLYGAHGLVEPVLVWSSCQLPENEHMGSKKMSTWRGEAMPPEHRDRVEYNKPRIN